jgi:uncharacterized membrane protein
VKRSGVFLLIGVIMLLVAVCFIVYAFHNPQASFPWGNSLTYGIYLIYIAATIFFLIKGLAKNRPDKMSG